MRDFKWKRSVSILVAMLFTLGLIMPQMASAAAGGIGNVATLQGVALPAIPQLAQGAGIIRSTSAAIQLGKALFWDMQAGSDGNQACASCHFQAGSDVRITNTVSPGFNGTFETSLAGTTPPGQILNAGVFPFASDDVVGSQGVIKKTFTSLSGAPKDNCSASPDTTFNVLGLNTRQVTGRNAPSVINAAFHFRLFWDGRANNIFNGANPFGPTGIGTSDVALLKLVGTIPTPTPVAIPNSALASQATGPPLNPVEMSCQGRTFPLLGRKLMGLKPLGKQVVAKSDSVLGSLSAQPGNGLNTTYTLLIKQAFDPSWWKAPAGFTVNGFKMIENNFSFFWGIALMMYEQTLRSDQSPVDNFLGAANTPLPTTVALPGGGTGNAANGAALFVTHNCHSCHSGSLMSNAVTAANNGFRDTGVRPHTEDPGDINNTGQGLFKTPGLRNVELNGAYFHTGGKATLAEVIDFYAAGGDSKPNQFSGGFALVGTDRNDMIAFLVACTDPRVKNESAPFDHPSLTLPNGGKLPPIGAGGRSAKGLPPLAPFTP